MEKPKLMDLHQQFQEEFLDFHGIQVVHAKGNLKGATPQALQKKSADAKACGWRRRPDCRRIVDDVDICRS